MNGALFRDINISLEKFASLLHLSCERVDIYNVDLHDFVYPEGESAHTASILFHDDDNPALVGIEEVKYYTLTAQVLAKIVFYNLPLFLRHQLLQKTLISRRVDPFC